MQAIQDVLEPYRFDVSDDKRKKIMQQVKAKQNLSQSRPITEMVEPSAHWGERSNAKVIAVYNFKGGVGKTTTAANLGASLAKGFTENGVAPPFQPKRVLMIDADAQANLTGYFVPEMGDTVDLTPVGAYQLPANFQPAGHGIDPRVIANHVPNNAHVASMDHLMPNSVAQAAPMPDVVSPLMAVNIQDLFTCLNGPMSGDIGDLEPPEHLFRCHPHIYGDNLLLDARKRQPLRARQLPHPLRRAA